jgi:hypothetical protein
MAEVDRLCNAQRYEHNAARRDTRAGHYERVYQGRRVPAVPKLRIKPIFNSAIY